MDDTKEEKKESTSDNSGERDKPEVYKSIDDANFAAKRMEDIHKKFKEENDRFESLYARQVLGGQTDAGNQPEKKEEISEEDYVNKVMSGKFKKENGKE